MGITDFLESYVSITDFGIIERERERERERLVFATKVQTIPGGVINRQIDLVCNGLARSKSRIERVIPREGETTLGTVKVRVWSVSWKLPSRLGSFFFKPCSVLPTLDKLSQRRDCCRYTKTLASNRRQTETETLISKYVQTRRIFLRSTHARFRHVRKIVKRIGIGVDRTFARERERKYKIIGKAIGDSTRLAGERMDFCDARII